MTSTDTTPLILHGRRRRSAARLDSGVLSLDAGGVRRRIPVAVIERVDVAGRGGRVLTVVLTSASGPRTGIPSADTYSIRSRSAPAVRAFAEAVRRALPVRGADEPRGDGAARVTVAPLERPGLEPGNVVRWTLAIPYTLVAVALVARGAGKQAVLGWVVGVPLFLVPGVAAFLGGLSMLRDTVVLRARGIAVEGSLTRSSGTDEDVHHVYSYVDARGERRERGGREGGPLKVEIVYDPEDPEGTTSVGRATVWRMLGGAAIALLLGLPMTAYGLYMAGMALAALPA